MTVGTFRFEDLRYDHIYHCWAKCCWWNPVILTGIHVIGSLNEGEGFPQANFVHFQVGHTHLQHLPTESCSVWVWFLCELCFIHLNTIDNVLYAMLFPGFQHASLGITKRYSLQDPSGVNAWHIVIMCTLNKQ